MPVRLITCPDSAHLEMIEYDASPCGMLVLACSRYGVGRDGVCPRRCAALFDQRDRALTRPVTLHPRSLLR